MKSYKTLILQLLVFSLPEEIFAQTSPTLSGSQQSPVPEIFFNPNLYILSLLFLVMLITIIVLSKAVRLLSKKMLVVQHEPEVKILIKEEVNKVSIWRRFDRAVLTKAVPIEKEKDIMFEHSYDGIHELDNDLPPWWKYGFYLTIIWAILYLFSYHVIHTGKLQLAEYNTELMEAEKAKQAQMLLSKENVTEESVIALADAETISVGKDIFSKNCVACHGQSAEGMVGPNLTDNFWLHGGGVKNIFKTISNGIPAKGMISWKSQLSAKQIQSLASFILTLQGTNPANPKEPQGDEWKESIASTDTLKTNTNHN